MNSNIVETQNTYSFVVGGDEDPYGLYYLVSLDVEHVEALRRFLNAKEPSSCSQNASGCYLHLPVSVRDLWADGDEGWSTEGSLYVLTSHTQLGNLFPIGFLLVDENTTDIVFRIPDETLLGIVQDS